MNFVEEGLWVAGAVREAYRRAELPWPPKPCGPVPLDRMIGALPLVHEEVAGLNHAVVAGLLGRWGIRFSGIPDPDPPLAGFLFANARRGYIFVRRGDGLTRRRFTAAHELGHYCLHLAPSLARGDQNEVELTQADAEVDESAGSELATMERQANRFASDLLMPEAACRELFERHAGRFGTTTRFLVHQLAGELLVSREAMHWRLHGLGLAEKPCRPTSGLTAEAV